MTPTRRRTVIALLLGVATTLAACSVAALLDLESDQTESHWIGVRAHPDDAPARTWGGYVQSGVIRRHAKLIAWDLSRDQSEEQSRQTLRHIFAGRIDDPDTNAWVHEGFDGRRYVERFGRPVPGWLWTPRTGAGGGQGAGAGRSAVPGGGLNTRATIDAWGWPLPALASEVIGPSIPGGYADRVVRGVKVRGSILPTRPLWAGLVVDSLVLALAWLAFLVTLASLRRAARRRRGRCAACGYDLRGTRPEACPECGAARSTRAGRTRSEESDGDSGAIASGSQA